jgi:hypothetical protein
MALLNRVAAATLHQLHRPRLNSSVNCLRIPIGHLLGTCCPPLKVSVKSGSPHGLFLFNAADMLESARKMADHMSQT